MKHIKLYENYKEIPSELNFEYFEKDNDKIFQIIFQNDVEIGNVTYLDDEIWGANIKETYRRHGYYTEALFDYVRHFNRELWSTSQGRNELSQKVWDKIKLSTPTDLLLKYEYGDYILTPKLSH